MSNKLAVQAGLTFNVNHIKEKGLKPYFEQHDLNVPLFKKAHVLVAAVLEKVCSIILTEPLRHADIDKSGLKTVDRELFRTAVLLNKELETYYTLPFRRFESERMYSCELPVSKSDLDKYIEKSFGDKVTLTQKARNFLNYMLSRVFLDICRLSADLLAFSGKKTMEKECVNFSLKMMFRDTSVYKTLCTEINRAWEAVVDVKEEGEPDDEEEENNNDSDVEDKKPKKAKKSDKKKKAEAVDESSDEDNDNNSDNESDNESDSEAEKKKAKNKKSNKKGKKDKTKSA